MRAKEFIVANEATLKYPAEIRKIIDKMPGLFRLGKSKEIVNFAS